MTEECDCPACVAARALKKFKLSSDEHSCYYCGDKETILIPVCKGCLDSFCKSVTEILTKADQK